MTRKFHSDCEVMLMEYAAGTLDEAQSLVAASYITLSPLARRYVESCERLGGAIIEGCCPPVSMNAASLTAVLDKLEECPAGDNSCRQEALRTFAESLCLPTPLHTYLTKACSHKGLRWRNLAPGIKICAIPLRNPTRRAHLMQLAPGTITPAHSHRGRECMLVLEGGFSDENGHYERGDLLLMDDGSDHHPIADPLKGCLCLVTTDAPVRPHSLTRRFFQIFLRY
ncbi:MAG: cupin domain-containing protein [Rhodospirillales bacterium]|nr:cupin domain-containing protein [Rhodospirillales bacterium]